VLSQGEPREWRDVAVNFDTCRPFKVIQGHWFWYQSKTRMRVSISPS